LVPPAMPPPEERVVNEPEDIINAALLPLILR
jgi:hypothetical protein